MEFESLVLGRELYHLACLEKMGGASPLIILVVLSVNYCLEAYVCTFPDCLALLHPVINGGDVGG